MPQSIRLESYTDPIDSTRCQETRTPTRSPLCVTFRLCSALDLEEQCSTPNVVSDLEVSTRVAGRHSSCVLRWKEPRASAQTPYHCAAVARTDFGISYLISQHIASPIPRKIRHIGGCLSPTGTLTSSSDPGFKDMRTVLRSHIREAISSLWGKDAIA